MPFEFIVLAFLYSRGERGATLPDVIKCVELLMSTGVDVLLDTGDVARDVESYIRYLEAGEIVVREGDVLKLNKDRLHFALLKGVENLAEKLDIGGRCG